MEKLFIKNRKGQKVCVFVEQPAGKPKGLAIVMHGRSGGKDEPHIATFARAFLNNAYTVIRFDTTNTFGESEGKFEDVTLTGFYEDLEDVISWSKMQAWYQSPFCLAGHSLGAIAVALYAEKHPEEVKALAPISTVVSGEHIIGAMDRGVLEEWKRTGWWIQRSVSKQGLIKRLKWSHATDLLQYDLMPAINQLTMPILMVVGSDDVITPWQEQKGMFDALPHQFKEFHLIQGAPHTFRDPAHLAEIEQIFNAWIQKL